MKKSADFLRKKREQIQITINAINEGQQRKMKKK